MALGTVLVVQAIVSLLIAAVYLYVGRLVMRRSVRSEGRGARRAFTLWWYALGVVTALGAASNIVGATGYRSLAFSLFMLFTILALIMVALGGLHTYLIYLYTGWRRSHWPPIIGYSLLGVVFFAVVAWMQPVGIHDGEFSIEYDFARELPTSIGTALGLSLTLPVLASVVAYGTLYFQTPERIARYRIAMVTLAFVVWFGWSVVMTLLNIDSESVTMQFVTRGISLVGPVMIFLAYHPPAAILRRFSATAAEAGAQQP